MYAEKSVTEPTAKVWNNFFKVFNLWLISYESLAQK